MKKINVDSAEPHFYFAFVLKGTEKQYLNLLKYLNGRNGSSLIYQCKSLTYLRIARDDGVRIQSAPLDILAENKLQEGTKS